MKKQLILLVFAALGAATLSCADATYDEVEQVLKKLKNEFIKDTICKSFVNNG